MDNHPIPQDVTGFKFKLIGSVTVKQFLYLLGFGILATIVFVLQINFILKIPIMLLFAGIGASLAFLPIEGRPMDVMLVNFAKSIPSENRYIFKKRGANLASFAIFEPPKQTVSAALIASNAQKTRDPNIDRRAMLISRLRNSAFRPDKGEERIINNIHTYFSDSTKTVSAPPIVLKTPIAADVQSPEVEKLDQPRLDAIEKEAAKKRGIEEAEQKKQAQQEQQAPRQTVRDNIKLSDEEQAHKAPENIPAPDPLPENSNPSLAGGFPTLPDVGNVILGMVRDARGKTLPNILVEVVDSNGVPVRAFKTNALGQFASATQLQNGPFRVLFSDPGKQHEFQPIEINLTGEIFQPLEIVSLDAREKLRRELFGGAPAV